MIARSSGKASSGPCAEENIAVVKTMRREPKADETVNSASVRFAAW
eukprot:CAMPEP_0184028456 /NCGR_PEP_ID=MMETSP0954-20121128/14853_1 /TAXON_ID=627963 /ORGANISM="Aplanochytrium sp, Strain PBS07" /LENGTH=45 /DNA_ID= /DNA_START= /DNA_END= /DNA_ORIENTATION=